MVSAKVQPLLPRRRLLQDSLGRPLRDLRLSVIDRCNFRCPYCMPREHFPNVGTRLAGFIFQLEDEQ